MKTFNDEIVICEKKNRKIFLSKDDTKLCLKQFNDLIEDKITNILELDCKECVY